MGGPRTDDENIEPPTSALRVLRDAFEDEYRWIVALEADAGWTALA